MMAEIKNIVLRLTNNAESLIENVDNNPCEQFNSLINKHIGGKKINFTQSHNYQTRIEAAVIAFNTKNYLHTIKKNITTKSPGKEYKIYLFIYLCTHIPNCLNIIYIFLNLNLLNKGKFGKRYITNIERIRNNTIMRRRKLFISGTGRSKIQSKFNNPDKDYGLAEPLCDILDDESFKKNKEEFLNKLYKIDRDQLEFTTRDQNLIAKSGLMNEKRD